MLKANFTRFIQVFRCPKRNIYGIIKMSCTNFEYSAFSLLHFLTEEKLANEISPLSTVEQANRYTDLNNETSQPISMPRFESNIY
jgi:hypothetical protein